MAKIGPLDFKPNWVAFRHQKQLPINDPTPHREIPCWRWRTNMRGCVYNVLTDWGRKCFSQRLLWSRLHCHGLRWKSAESLSTKELLWMGLAVKDKWSIELTDAAFGWLINRWLKSPWISRGSWRKYLVRFSGLKKYKCYRRIWITERHKTDASELHCFDSARAIDYCR